jgi:hypothetical protein
MLAMPFFPVTSFPCLLLVHDFPAAVPIQNEARCTVMAYESRAIVQSPNEEPKKLSVLQMVWLAGSKCAQESCVLESLERICAILSLHQIMVAKHPAGVLLCRFLALSLANMILRSAPGDPSAFTMIVGIGDSTYFGESAPTWDMPLAAQDLCYIGVQQLLLSAMIRSQIP